MMKTLHKQTFMIFLCALLCAVSAGFLSAQAALLSDVNEIIRLYEKNTMSETAKMSAELTVADQFGASVHTFDSYSRKNGDTLVVVTKGPDKGQKILRLESSIFLFYPEAEQVIRLSGSALKDSVMGSDFSYEDLTGDNSIQNNYSAVLKGIAAVDEVQCYHVELTAKNRRQTYQKQELYIDTAFFIPRKTILYSASGRALREMVSSDVKKIGTRNAAMTSVMTDLLKKKSTTTMRIISAEFDTALDDKLFSRDELSW